MADIVEFNGVRFYRYPDSSHRANRRYFTPGIADRQKGADYLHREIWKAAHGEIPEGHHVHHRDGNPLNNDIDNLVCISPKQHIAEHWTEERAVANREWAAKIRPLTKAWHGSPEGREWHRRQARESYKKRQSLKRDCDHCGTEFDSISRRDNDRFCSNNCKSAWRRGAGIDDHDRTCPICGSVYRCNKHARKKTCSRPCANELSSRTKRGLQPDGSRDARVLR